MKSDYNNVGFRSSTQPTIGQLRVRIAGPMACAER
jgi:hypothetical protein